MGKLYSFYLFLKIFSLWIDLKKEKIQNTVINMVDLLEIPGANCCFNFRSKVCILLASLFLSVLEDNLLYFTNEKCIDFSVKSNVLCKHTQIL